MLPRIIKNGSKKELHIFSRHVVFRAKSHTLTLKVLNEFEAARVGGGIGKITGFAGVVLGLDFCEARIFIEGSMQALLEACSIMTNHDDVIFFNFHGPKNPLGRHFYDDFIISAPLGLELHQEGLHQDGLLQEGLRLSGQSRKSSYLTRKRFEAVGEVGKKVAVEVKIRAEAEEDCAHEGAEGGKFSPMSPSVSSPMSTSVSSPMSPASLIFKRKKVLQFNDKKFVFVVENTETEEKQVLKEVTAYSELELDQVMKEYECIVSLHTPSPSFGIISPPTMFKEELRCTMVYKMHHCDLFNFLNEYCNHTGKRGVPEGTARLWIAQLLVAVKAMVGKGVAHRDLKPENILLDCHGNVVLTDFELATSVGKAGKEEEDGVPPQVVGTPLYIPPEVGSKRFCDIKKNDIWSLGVIAWEMVHDSNPWKLNVDRMPPYEVLLQTNQTTTLVIDAMERGMSDEYFDFVRGCVREHNKRFTVEEAMKHKIFEGIDFGDMGALFKQDGVHELLGEVWGVFKDIQKEASLGSNI